MQQRLGHHCPLLHHDAYESGRVVYNLAAPLVGTPQAPSAFPMAKVFRDSYGIG